MNNRIKQFVNDNDQKIRVAAGVVSLGAFALLTRKAINGNTVVSADYFARSNGESLIFLTLKNGAVKAFTNTPIK